MEQLVEDTLQRDHWTTDQWRDWHQQRLGELLQIAATRVPYYRTRWESQPDADWRSLSNWPVLEKESLRASPEQFCAAGQCRLREENTSGTTGTPMRLWFDKLSMRQWYALFEARSRRWYGVNRHDRWAILGGRLIKPAFDHRPPFWVWNGALHQLYLSSYHLSASSVRHYLDALEHYRVKYFYGYTSALYELACDIKLARCRPPELTVIITNAEPLFDYQREAIGNAFGCPVRETYGMSEQCGGASECEAGFLHLWPDAGYLEVLRKNEAVNIGETADLVFTGLINRSMPLIRYRIGDRGALLADSRPCPCGRTLPRLARLEGRADDVLFTARGDRIGRLDPVFKHNVPIREAQIIQESTTRLLVKYVPTDEFGPRHVRQIEHELKSRLGEMSIEFQAVSEIPRGANGKFRAVINQMPVVEKNQRSHNGD
jgi:phenylacetate-CoA ligase